MILNHVSLVFDKSYKIHLFIKYIYYYINDALTSQF